MVNNACYKYSRFLVEIFSYSRYGYSHNVTHVTVTRVTVAHITIRVLKITEGLTYHEQNIQNNVGFSFIS